MEAAVTSPVASRMGTTTGAADQTTSSSTEEPQLIRSRVANACDGCKARKVKCDGKLPCSYCSRRQRPQACRYSPPQQRRRPRPRGHSKQPRTPRLTSPPASVHNGNRQGDHYGTPSLAASDFEHSSITAATTTDHSSQNHHVSVLPTPQDSSSGHHPVTRSMPAAANSHAHRRSSDADVSAEDHEEAEVPREARLLCDAQGKLIFIGDCAPLSFFQTVRQLVTSRVDQNAFAPQTSRYSVLENAISRSSFFSGGNNAPPEIKVTDNIPGAVSNYLCVTSGLVDLFINESRLVEDITMWAPQPSHGIDDISSAVNYLVLAIGIQKTDEESAQLYFEYARDQALANLNGTLSIDTVQVFVLITLYMLCACQINGAFLFFGIAVRAAYSIGVHRTEVNNRFGPETHRQRDRLWKSLRIVDLFLSTSMGRPPSTSDVDCTVPYRQLDNDGHEVFDVLNASVQIFLILEGVVLEVYSRRKISLQLTEGISRQLRDFSVRWLHQLKNVVSSSIEDNAAEVNGACQALTSYYYAVMLVSRPFLLYELYKRLSPEQPAIYGRAGLMTGKSKLADACIDAASLMVDQILDLIDKGIVSGRRPVLVSWLFAGSLVLGAGLLGGFGRILEKYARMSITALDHFAKIDAHATQYSMISKSLLTTALEYLEKKEVQERLQRTESSAQLFGLLPNDSRDNTESNNKSNTHSLRRSAEMSRRAAPSPMSTSTHRGDRPERGLGHLNESNHNHHHQTHYGNTNIESPLFSDLDPAFLTLSNTMPRTPDLSILSAGLGMEGDDSSFGGFNLFPLLETGGGGGHIDLANYLSP